VLLPRLDSIDRARIGIRLEVSAKPQQVNTSRIVAALGFGLDIAGLAKPSQPAAHRRLSDGKQLSRRFVRPASLRSICLYQPSLQIDRKVHFNL
jgi:hypothetical protein